MSVYERTFGTDWNELDRPAVLHRAFALGVAESLGEDPPDGELDRLRTQVAGRYSRSLVDLAYDEGRTKGRVSRSGDADAVWSDLVESDGDATRRTGGPAVADRPARRLDLPEAVTAPRFSTLDRDEFDRQRLPGFLR